MTAVPLRFGTLVTCIDGRVQRPTIIWMREQYNIDFVDVISEPGPDKLLAEADPNIVVSVEKKVAFSVRAHVSRIVGICGHFDCAGNPAMPDFGAFTIAADRPTLAMQAGTGERYRLTARNGLRLREGPGSQFDIIGGLQSDQIVVVVSIAEGWALLDLEGDGRVDGYASAGFLERL